MEANNLNIHNFVNDPEASEQEMLLKLFHFKGNESNTLNIDEMPALMKSGCIALCNRGSFLLRLDEREFDIKTGDMCTIFPNTLVQISFRSPDLDCWVLAGDIGTVRNLPIKSMSELYLLIRETPCIAIRPMERNILMTCFDYIRLSYSRKHFPYRIEVTRQLMMVLGCEVAAIYQKGKRIKDRPNTHRDRVFHRFIRLLSDNYMRERRVEFYARKLCLSPKYLASLIKTVSQKTAAEWIDEFVIRHIKRMLLTSPQTVQQISAELNFPNASFFAQYFKRATGKTPRQFRLMAK